MIELSIGIVAGLFLFCCTIVAYAKGVENGMDMFKGKAPKIELNPIKPILKAIKQHEEEKEVKALADDLTEALGYSKESAMQAVKKERSI